MFKRMKGMTFKQKLGYFNDYYKWPTIITIVVIAMIISIVSSYFRYNYNTCLNITIVNGSFKDYSSWEKTLNKEFKIDGKKDKITFNISNFTNSKDSEVNRSTYEKLVNCFFARSIDVYLGTKTDIDYFSKSRYFFKLTEILSEEKLKELTEKNMVFYTKDIEYTEDEKPYTVDIPVGIYASSLKRWDETTAVMDEPIICFARNTTNRKNIEKFIELYLE